MLSYTHIFRQAITEKELIESRIGCQIPSEKFICSQHRYSKGYYWSQRQKCAFSEKFKNCTPCVSTKTAISIEFYKKISKTYILPLFGKICKKHRAEILENMINKMDSDIDEKIELDEEENDSEEEKNYRKEKKELMNDILEKLNVPNKTSQILKPISELGNNRIRDVNRQFKIAQTAFSIGYCEAVAPRQGQILLEKLREDNSKTSCVPHIKLVAYAEIYRNCASDEAKLGVLSTIPPEIYSKREILKFIPEASLYKINLARKLYKNNSENNKNEEPQSIHARLDEYKT